VNVDVRLFATLADAFAVRPGDVMPTSLLDGATIDTLIEFLGIDPQAVHLVMVKGRIVHDRSRALSDGDRVGLFPPVGGG